MTSTVRSVRVVMEADVAGYITSIRLAGHETDAAFSGIEERIGGTNRELKAVDTSASGAATGLKKVEVSSTSASRGVDQFGRSTKNARNELDSFSGRTGIFLKLAAGFAPALAPIASVGIPALAGLSSGLGFTVAAGGAAVLALHGVGDALKAIEAARLDPTTANLQAMHQALQQLDPAAQELVHHLEDLRDTGVALQHTAAGNFLPGVDDALTSLEKRIPIVEKILATVSKAGGDLVAKGGDELASSKFNAFFEYLRTEARPQLDALAESAGHVFHGIAELFVATVPGQHEFLSFLKESTEDFDQWATRIQKTQGLNDLFAYVKANGPQVEATIGAIANAVLQIVQAAAPLGGPTLKILQVLANVIGDIADSPLGTPLLAGAQALSLFGLALPLVNKGLAVATRSDLAFNSELGKTKGLLSGASAGTRGYISALFNTSGALNRATMSEAEFAAAERERSATVTRGNRALLAGAGAVAGFAALSSGLAGKLHLTNTATLAMAGSLAGPWGTAVGAGVGLILDFAGGQHKAVTDTATLSSTLDQQTGAITQNTAAYVAQQFAQNGILQNAQSLGISVADVTAAALGNADALARVNAQADAYQQTIAGSAPKQAAFADTFGNVRDAIGDTNSQLTDTRGKTALVAAAMGTYTAAVDTSSAANRAQAKAINDANKAMIAQVSAALAAFDAVTQYRQAVKAANAQADKSNAGIQGSSKDALANRDALSTLAGAWDNQSKAVRNNVGEYQKARANFIATAEAMGVPEAAAKALANQLLDIPRSVVVKVSAETAAAQAAIAAVGTDLRNLHDRDLYIHVHTVQGANPVGPDQTAHGGTGAPPPQPPKTKTKAAGGYITGPGTKTSDSIPARLSHGEYVQPAASVDHYGLGMMEAIRARRFAAGGLVGGITAADTHSSTNPADRPAGSDQAKARDGHGPDQFLVTLGAAALLASKNLHELKVSSADLTKQEKKLQSTRDALQSEYDSVKSNTASMLTSDLFSTTSASGNPWQAGSTPGGASDPDAVLKADIANAQAYAKLEAALKKRGLDDGALETVAAGGTAALSTVNNYSDAQLAQFEQDYATRASLVGQVSTQTAQDVVGSRLDKTNDKLDKVVDELRDVKQAIKVETTVEKEGHKGTQDAIKSKKHGSHAS